MTYYKNITDNYIASISTSCGQIPIAESEYNAIMEIINGRPSDSPDGYIYRLNAKTLNYELCEAPIIEITDEEGKDDSDFIASKIIIQKSFTLDFASKANSQSRK